MSKIIGVIPPQNYELIRNKIAEIIAIELEHQFAISYDPDFDCNVWLERTTPFDSEEMTPAVINVSFIDGNYQNEDPVDADGLYSYAVDVYARSYTNEENIGDTRAALIVQKVIGKIRAILMATVYKTVDTGLGIVKNRRVASVQVYDPKRHPQGDDSTTFDQAGRIVFNVTAIETVEVIQPNQITGADTWVRWCCTDKGYVWINDGQTNGTPGNPNVCPPIPPIPPLGPYLRTVSVDGVTITGDGTPSNPLKGSPAGNSILLQTDGVDNESQTVLNLKQGNNITITDDGDGGVTIQANGTLGVNSVTATAPLVSSGGANPDISIPQATTSVDGYLSSIDWDTFNDKQDALTLTTTGTSGAATLVGSVLNIPQYSSTGGGAVDSVNGQTGTVVLDTDDINDTATNRYTTDTDITRLANTSGTNTGDQDLSGLALKVTTISTNAPLTGGGDLSANRTLSIPQANGSTDGYLDSADWNTFNGKFNSPTGNNTQYLDGAGTPTTFPSIPPAQVNSDWNAVSGVAEILNKPSIPAAQIQSDWNQANNAALDFIKNKPTITSGTVTSVNSGINISVDNTNPAAPIINSLSDRYKTTSTTSNSVSNGSKSFTVDLNLSYIPLQEILVVFDAANHMHGEVTSYNAATGALVVDIKNHTGSGTYTAWTLNLDGTPVDALTGSGTTNEIAYFTAARVLASLPVATYPSLTELSYVKGVTSAIQTQINGKQNTLTEGTGIDITSNVITNTAPDQTVVLNEGTGIDITGTYPNFTIANTINGFIRSEYTASGAATLDIPIPSGYSKHVITVQNAVAGTANSQLWARMGIGAPSVIQSGATDYTWARGGTTNNAAFGSSSAGDSVINLNGATMPTGASGRSINMQLVLNNASGTTFNKSVQGTFVGQTNAGQIITQTLGGILLKLDAITSLRLLCSTGNISATVVIESYL